MAGPAFTRSHPSPPNRWSLRARSACAMAVAIAAGLSLAQAAEAQVQVQSLAPPDLFSTGAARSDLPSDLWRGSSGTLARLVIPELAAHPLTPAAAALARHVLEVGGNGPDGAGNDPDLAGARAEALLQLGDLATAATITDGASNLPQLTALSRVAAEVALIAGRDDRACAIGDGLVMGREGSFWLRLRAYCQARAGQSAPAQLTLDLSDQQERRPEFDRLMTALLAGAPGAGTAAAADDALDFAISRRLGLDWPAALAAAPASIAVAVARDPTAPVPARLAAAARAARLGVATPETYAAIAPPPTTLPPADASGPAGEAALVALAASTNDLTLKESAIIALLRRAGNGPEFEALSRLVAPAIGQLMTAHPVLRQPFLFAVAAAAAGDAASAQAARAQVGHGGAAPPAADLAILDALTGVVAAPVDGAAAEPLTAASVHAANAVRSRTAGALALLGAYVPLGPEARFEVADADIGAGGAPSGRRLAMEQAAEQGRIGDTALYVLGTCVEAGAAGPGPAERALMVRALRLAHLDGDARAFAIEGLVALQARP